MKLTEKEKLRVQVCKDVVKQLKIGKYEACHGYCYLSDKINPAKELQKELKKVRCCSVCALGATFLSLVRVKNNYIPDKHSPIPKPFFGAGQFEREDLEGKLKGLWPSKELEFLENVYEENISDTMHVISDELYDDERLKAIMLHMIKNKGSIMSLKRGKLNW